MPSSTFQAFSDAMVTAFSAALSTYTFSAGRPPDSLPPATSAVAFVWVERSEQDSANKLIELVTAGVRLYPIQAEQFDGTTPIDPSPLYAAASALQDAVLANPRCGMWTIEVPGVEIDHDNQMVTVEILGTSWNAAMPT